MMNIISLKSKALAYIGPRLYKTRCLDKQTLEKAQSILIEDGDFRYLTHSTYNVAYIKTGEICGYFRECRKHEEKRAYLKTVISDYFRFVSPCDHSGALIREMEQYLSDSKNLKLFLKMGVKNDPGSGIAKFFNDPKNSQLIGIPNSHSAELEKELVDLLQFLWGEILTYNMCIKFKKGAYQTFNTNRQVATFELAKMLNVAYLIPKTQYVKLVFPDGKEKVGTLMNEAAGFAPEKLTEEVRKSVGPVLQKRMNELCLLDLICRQTDHRPGHDGNYFVSFDENGLADSVEAFDNDAPTSFTLSKKIHFVTSARTSPFMGRDDRIIYPYLSKEMVDTVKTLSKKDILEQVGPYLTKVQCQYIWRRVQNLKATVERNLLRESVKLLREEEWSSDTVRAELDLGEKENIVTYLYAYYALIY